MLQSQQGHAIMTNSYLCTICKVKDTDDNECPLNCHIQYVAINGMC